MFREEQIVEEIGEEEKKQVVPEPVGEQQQEGEEGFG